MPESLLTSRRRLLQAGGSLMLLMLSGASLAGGAGVIAVRSWPSATYTRITLESDGALKYRSFTMSSPNRLVIDLEGVQLNAVLREFSERAIDDPYIR
ncbi:MAG: AMIN domain-containing protein, partial [Laribacter sp.]|nr:AMIN domain-containing protein [Laribacter sp.]